MQLRKKYIRYVAQNILGMVGLSLYIIVDSIFIAKSDGTDGITALNLVLPVYALIYAIGAMIGVGSAILFNIEKSKQKENPQFYFFNALFFSTVLSLIFVMIGLFAPDKMMKIMGADAQITSIGKSYTRIFMSFAPFFMWNYICNAFVRNDNAPTIAMAATLISSLFNIVFDYVLIFPCHMGMAGAALATALSPVVGIAICCVHLCTKKSSVKLKLAVPSIKKLLHSCRVGVSAFVGEISSGIITMVFNYLILSLTGNVGVAAYGVVANSALVAVAFFNGVANGTQPLVSEKYGLGKQTEVKRLQKMSLLTAFLLALILYTLTYLFAKNLTGLFNSEQNPKLEELAIHGLRV